MIFRTCLYVAENVSGKKEGNPPCGKPREPALRELRVATLRETKKRRGGSRTARTNKD